MNGGGSHRLRLQSGGDRRLRRRKNSAPLQVRQKRVLLRLQVHNRSRIPDQNSHHQFQTHQGSDLGHRRPGEIFDWVHRRFAHKDGLTESGRKNCAVDDGDSFNHNNALNVFDDWKEGILTIGTLGYDPLKDEAEKQPAEKEIEIHGGEITDSEEEDEVDEEEANAYPLVYAAAAAAAAYAHDCEALLGIKGDSSNRMNDEFDFESEFDAMIMNIPKKERITLAELFTADSELFADDSEKKKKKKLGDQKLNKETKPNSNKNGFSFAKKLIGDKDARPIQKLHRLMRMMMNRKIHPDEGMDGVKSSDKSSSETASLLPTQVADAMI